MVQFDPFCSDLNHYTGILEKQRHSGLPRIITKLKNISSKSSCVKAGTFWTNKMEEQKTVAVSVTDKTQRLAAVMVWAQLTTE